MLHPYVRSSIFFPLAFKGKPLHIFHSCFACILCLMKLQIPFEIRHDTSCFVTVMALFLTMFHFHTFKGKRLQSFHFTYMCLMKLQVPFEIGRNTLFYLSYGPLLTLHLVSSHLKENLQFLFIICLCFLVKLQVPFKIGRDTSNFIRFITPFQLNF